MKLRVRKGLFSRQLINATGQTVSTIYNKKWFGAAKNICDEKGNLVFTTDIVNLPAEKRNRNHESSRRYMIYKEEKPIATAKLSFARSEPKKQTFFFRPPRVDKMDIETPYGLWVVERQKKNGLTISQNGVPLGKVTPFFAFNPVYLEYTGKYEAAFWAGIYALIEYMMHEDNIIIV